MAIEEWFADSAIIGNKGKSITLSHADPTGTAPPSQVSAHHARSSRTENRRQQIITHGNPKKMIKPKDEREVLAQAAEDDASDIRTKINVGPLARAKCRSEDHPGPGRRHDHPFGWCARLRRRRRGPTCARARRRPSQTGSAVFGRKSSRPTFARLSSPVSSIPPIQRGASPRVLVGSPATSGWWAAGDIAPSRNASSPARP